MANLDAHRIPQGMDWLMRFTLAKDGALYPIPLTTNLRAALIYKCDYRLATPIKTLVDTESGADWPNGVAVVKFSSEDTRGMTEIDDLHLEVVAIESGETIKWIFEHAAVVVRSLID